MQAEQAVRASFTRQTFLRTIGAVLVRVAPGEVDVELPLRGDLLQQSGMLHGGAIATVADVACGYAALTLMPEGSEVLSVEFKLNLQRRKARRHDARHDDPALILRHVNAWQKITPIKADPPAIRKTSR